MVFYYAETRLNQWIVGLEIKQNTNDDNDY